MIKCKNYDDSCGSLFTCPCMNYKQEDPVQTVLDNLEVIDIQPEEVLIWKFDTNEVDLKSADGYVNYLGEKFPNNTVIGMFEHTTLDAYEKEAAIKYIEQILEVLKNDNSERSEEQEHY